MLISHLTNGPLRFTELPRSVDGISHRMPTRTLRGLERDGLVSRTAFAQIPPRVEYELTAVGATLIEPVNGLVAWAEDYQDDVDAHRERYDRTRRP